MFIFKKAYRLYLEFVYGIIRDTYLHTSYK